MPEVKVYLTDEQYLGARKYADEDERSLSNLFVHALAGLVKRSKKTDENGEVIVFPKPRRRAK